MLLELYNRCPDLFYVILDQLSPQDIFRAHQVCSSWDSRLRTTRKVWTRLWSQHYSSVLPYSLDDPHFVTKLRAHCRRIESRLHSREVRKIRFCIRHSLDVWIKRHLSDRLQSCLNHASCRNNVPMLKYIWSIYPRDENEAALKCAIRAGSRASFEFLLQSCDYTPGDQLYEYIYYSRHRELFYVLAIYYPCPEMIFENLVSDRNEAIVTHILANRSHPPDYDFHLDTLITFIRCNWYQAFTLVCQHNLIVVSMDEVLRTIELHYEMLRFDRVNFFHFFVERGAPIGLGPMLVEAVRFQAIEIASYLVRRFGNRIPSNYQTKALISTVQANHVDMATALMEAGMNLFSSNDQAYRLAYRLGRSEIIDIFEFHRDRALDRMYWSFLARK